MIPSRPIVKSLADLKSDVHLNSYAIVINFDDKA